MSGYGEDLAFVHESGFTQLAEAAARMVLDEIGPPAAAERRGLAVDLGCGGGTLLRELVDAGFEGWGVDLSPEMVALARKRVPEATLAVGDALAVDLPPCQVVTAIGEVFNYAFVEHDQAAIEAAFARIHDALEPGGILLFDVATPGRAADGPTSAQRAGRGWRVEATAQEQGAWLTRTIDTWRTVAGQTRHSREVHRLRLLEAGWIMGALRAAGFDAEHLGGYDDFGFQPGWDGFLARRPAARS